MAEKLSGQLRDFRKRLESWSALRVTITPEMHGPLDALFASLEAQAKLMEMGPHPMTIGDVAEQARLCDEEAAAVWDFVDSLRARRKAEAEAAPSNVVPLFPARRRPAPSAPFGGAPRRETGDELPGGAA